MIDPQTAQEAMALLSSAIGELAEDVAAEAVTMRPGEPEAMALRAQRLITVGGEMVSLADALSVLSRYGDRLAAD